MQILRIPKVLEQTGYRSHNSIYTAIKAGLFPTSIKLSERSVGWPDNEIQAINAARIAGKSDEEIKALVTRLQAKRLEEHA